MSLTRDVFQLEIGPYVASASLAFLSQESTATTSASRSSNAPQPVSAAMTATVLSSIGLPGSARAEQNLPHRLELVSDMGI